MITAYRVKNFKQLKDVHIKCKNINILIGPNGAGKSSLLQSIDFLKAFVMSSTLHYMETHNIVLRDLMHTWTKNNRILRRIALIWEVTLELPSENKGDAPYMYKYEVKLHKNHRISENIYMIRNQEEIPILMRNDRNYRLILPNGEVNEGNFLNPSSGFLATIKDSDRDRLPDLVRIKEFIENIQTFLIWDPALLRTRSRGSYNDLGPNGQNLAAVLAKMKANQPEQFTKMVRRLQKVLPNMTDIIIKGIRSGWKEINIVEKSIDGALTFNHRQISDGTLRLIAMALIRYGPSKHSIISIEEPENGVHPPILREAVRMIEEMTQLKPHLRTQIFFTTHNPYLLDLFQNQPESIYIMEKGDGESGTVVTNLSEQNIQTARLLFDNSMGDLWFSNFLPGKEESME